MGTWGATHPPGGPQRVGGCKGGDRAHGAERGTVCSKFRANDGAQIKPSCGDGGEDFFGIRSGDELGVSPSWMGICFHLCEEQVANQKQPKNVVSFPSMLKKAWPASWELLNDTNWPQKASSVPTLPRLPLRHPPRISSQGWDFKLMGTAGREALLSPRCHQHQLQIPQTHPVPVTNPLQGAAATKNPLGGCQGKP